MSVFHARIERLESRTMFSGVTMSGDGTLSVVGTGGEDLIMLELQIPRNYRTFAVIEPKPVVVVGGLYDPTVTRILVWINGETTEFTADDIRKVVVSAGDGDDTVESLFDLQLRAAGASPAPGPVDLVFDGGAGDDDLTVHRHHGPCELRGGAGNDRLEGPGTLDGGGGEDVLVPRAPDFAFPDRSDNSHDAGDLPPGADVRVRGRVLRIDGSAVADTIELFGPNAARRTVLVWFDDAQRVFDPTGLRRIVVNGAGGNDDVRITATSDGKAYYAVDLHGGTGRDTMWSFARRNHLFGDAGDDTLSAGSSRVVLRGGDGNDVLNGAGGNDLVVGGPGDDRLNGNGGSDTIRGGHGDDVLDDYERSDFRTPGPPERDRLDGGAGHDACVRDPRDRPHDIETFRPARPLVIVPY